jgi:hypothetical protein
MSKDKKRIELSIDDLSRQKRIKIIKSWLGKPTPITFSEYADYEDHKICEHGTYSSSYPCVECK